MEGWHGVIRSQHLGGEALLIDFGHAAIVSDHPQRYGGSNRGPMPGDLMKGALAASVVLALGAAGERGELPISSVVARCTSPVAAANPLADSDPSGRLKGLVYIPAFTVDIAIGGLLTDAQMDHVRNIAMSTRIARALSGDLDIHEVNIFPAGPTVDGEVALLADARGTVDPDRAPDTASPAFASVEYLGGGRALINWLQSSYLVTEDGGNAGSPEALLLASLAACTTVFSARAAHAAKADVDLRIVCEGNFGEDVATAGRIAKRLEIIGDLNAEQQASIGFFADNCALGETLRRRIPIEVNVHCIDPKGGRIGGLADARAALAETGAGCDDGLCCVPPSPNAAATA